MRDKVIVYGKCETFAGNTKAGAYLSQPLSKSKQARIEIIAAMVILVVLASVAIPKYQSLQLQAQINATQAALANSASQLSLSYVQCLLSQTTPHAISAAGAWTGCTASSAVTAQGDFTVSYGGISPSYTVKVTAGPTWFTINNTAITSALTAADMNPKTVVLQ